MRISRLLGAKKERRRRLLVAVAPCRPHSLSNATRCRMGGRFRCGSLLSFVRLLYYAGIEVRFTGGICVREVCVSFSRPPYLVIFGLVCRIGAHCSTSSYRMRCKVNRWPNLLSELLCGRGLFRAMGFAILDI